MAKTKRIISVQPKVEPQPAPPPTLKVGHRDITLQEIVASEMLMQRYQATMADPFVRILLRAVELSVKPVTPPDDKLKRSVGFGKHMYQCGCEDVLKLIRGVDLLGKKDSMPEADYGVGTIEQFMKTMDRKLEPQPQAEE